MCAQDHYLYATSERKVHAPTLTKANSILHHLMVIAQQVTSGTQYNWRRVAGQLGLSQNETYMNYMHQVEKAKNFYGIEDINTQEGEGGTQQSGVTSTHKEA
ncbi:lipid storage droplets surface-binding protein 2-like [Sesbania bispinosa]|nr:lipid storage droplets surface-binding protein 2-like [Sesbania bispinosa]